MDVGKYHLIASLMVSLPVLQHISLVEKVHPEHLYLVLARLAGALQRVGRRRVVRAGRRHGLVGLPGRQLEAEAQADDRLLVGQDRVQPGRATGAAAVGHLRGVRGARLGAVHVDGVGFALLDRLVGDHQRSGLPGGRERGHGGTRGVLHLDGGPGGGGDVDGGDAADQAAIVIAARTLIKVGPEVQSFALGAETYPAINREVAITVTEACTESSQREWLFDGITKKAEPNLKSYLGVEPKPVTADDLNEQAKAGAIIVPPQAKASMLTRDVISQAIHKIEADRIIEEKMQIDAIDLYYRPIYAVRYKWQQKEAVVEVDAVTGETRTGGVTFEAYMGKLIDRDFLLDAWLCNGWRDDCCGDSGDCVIGWMRPFTFIEGGMPAEMKRSDPFLCTISFRKDEKSTLLIGGSRQPRRPTRSNPQVCPHNPRPAPPARDRPLDSRGQKAGPGPLK